MGFTCSVNCQSYDSFANSFTPHSAIGGRSCYRAHFTGGEAEAPRPNVFTNFSGADSHHPRFPGSFSQASVMVPYNSTRSQEAETIKAHFLTAGPDVLCIYLIHLEPHKVVCRRNHTYFNNGVIVKATVASSRCSELGREPQGNLSLYSTVTSCLAFRLTLSWSILPSH